MKLFNLIRKKFMPPFEVGGKQYYSPNLFGYRLLKIDATEKFTPQLMWRTSNCYSIKNESNKYFFKKENEFNNEVEWFETSEEARGAAWDNFDYHYNNSTMPHKEAG